MEPATISEVNWSSNGSTEFSAFCATSSQHEHQFSGLVSAVDAEIMAQLFANYPYTNELSVAEHWDPFPQSNSSWADQEPMNMAVDGDNLYCYSNTSNPSFYNWSLGNHFIPHSDFEVLASSSVVKNGIQLMNSSVLKDFCLGGDQNDQNTHSELHFAPDNSWEEAVCQNKAMSGDDSKEIYAPDQILTPKRKLESLERAGIASMEENLQSEVALIKEGDQGYLANSDMTQQDYLSEKTQKKARVLGDVQRTSIKIQSKKNQKLVRTDEAEENTGFNGQSSSSYCSEDDSIASQELNGTTSSSKGSLALNVNGKTGARRGSATDPQSLYARRRRERINERLRILQNLVPNGTKVDISTMLEEAVQYVKFLQLQIKLLSSDDLWMYAPIAYNGMDIGLDLKISPPS